ncbi:MAG: rod shape-determining protein MreC [Lentisphaerae bacterium]|nr:rod shape-determining protein MreC [Lentisphaerota bacterium]
MRKTLFIGFGLAIVFAVLIHLPSRATRPLTGALRDAFAPLMTGLARSQAAVALSFSGAGDWREDMLRLEQERDRLKADLLRLQPLEEENRALRASLNLPAPFSRRWVAAEVISRDVNGWWRLIRINKGSRDGIERDMPVVVGDGVLGKTVDVSRYTSDVLLLTDPASRISATLPRTRSFGILRGQGAPIVGSPLCLMTFIDKNAECRPGDEVATSGWGDVYPRGLPIGHIRAVEMDRSGLYQSATLEPAADLRTLRFVFVVTDRAKAETEPSTDGQAPAPGGQRP